MNKKKNTSTLILAAVFLVLGIIYFTTSYRPPEVAPGASLLFEGNNPDIDCIEITLPNHIGIVLTRKNGLWFMDKPFQFKADDRYINNLVTVIQDVYIDGVISNRPEAQQEFQVDSTGVALKIFSAGNVLYDGVIGKHSQEIGHFYARRAGGRDIEIWRGMLSQDIRRSPDDWRDRTIFSINQDDVLKIEAVEGNNKSTLQFENSVWVYTENGVQKPVDNTRVRSVIGVISNLSAEDFANEDDIQQVVTRNYDMMVTLTVRNGDVLTYHLWNPTEKYTRWLLRKENGDLLYKFYDTYGNLLSLRYEDLQQPQL